ncbi:MAG: Mrp/NBP35 family ATP-binding protein [Proteobacteria bacterium]|nr:Mrp/NBP35 family ATP-binding protein [Pseudomonadota bacterium]
MISEEYLKLCLDKIPSPFDQKDKGLLESGCVESLKIEDFKIICVLFVPPIMEDKQKKIDSLVSIVKKCLETQAPKYEVFVITTNERSLKSPLKPWGVREVHNIIAVASGKGGVGKSTIALNLAMGLKNLGLKVGILDADVYGPSLPHLFNVYEKPLMYEGKKFKPILKEGLSLMSMGFLMDMEAPLIWRGPMIQGVITQLLTDVDWGNLDVLVVDLPPGTGDVQLTLAQKVPLSGAVIVSTPQDIALLDARKAMGMFEKLEVPILGVIENMSLFICPNCHHGTAIFSHGGARQEAEKRKLPFLGEIELSLKIREASDLGLPLSQEEGIASSFFHMAQKVKYQLDRLHLKQN